MNNTRQGQTLHPFAVAVFKNVMYWDDWNAQGIFMADKNRGTGLTTIASRMPGVMDLKVLLTLINNNNNLATSLNLYLSYSGVFAQHASRE